MIVAEGEAGAWSALLSTLGVRPAAVGGVLLYPISHAPVRVPDMVSAP